jgi:hypothetical protein
MSAAGAAEDLRARWAKPRPEGCVSARAGQPTLGKSHIGGGHGGYGSAWRRAIALTDTRSAELLQTEHRGQV